MAQFIFANFVETELLDDISAGAEVLHILPSMASRLPLFSLADDTEARLVLWDGVNLPEIVGVTENLGTGWLTITRAKESTSSRPWAAGTQVVCSLTADIINAALLAYFDITEVLNQNFLKLTGGSLTGALTLAGDPTLQLHAATKNYVDSVQGNKLPIAGGTMLGAINMNANRILNLPAPISVNEPSRKFELDAVVTSQTNLDRDRSGVLTTAGTTTAYTVTTNMGGTTYIDGETFSARMHGSNKTGATINKNGISDKPILLGAGVVVPEGYLRGGVPYTFVYDQSLDAWLILNASRGTTRNRAGDFKWSAIEVDHDDCMLCNNRSLLIADYPELYNNIGTKFGTNGAGTFRIAPSDGRALVGRGNTLGYSAYLATSSGVASATVSPMSTDVCVGAYIAESQGVFPAGTQITAVVGNTIFTNAAAIATGSYLSTISQIDGPNRTGAMGGVNSRAQTRQEVGRHLHSNFLTDPGHFHSVSGGNIAATSHGLTQSGVGSDDPRSYAGITINAALTGVSITNVDSPDPAGMPMLQPVLVANLFMYVR